MDTRVFLLVFVLSTIVDCLRIMSVNVPPVIQNGTKSSVVLDCQYQYEEYESQDLEVKWFWNDEPEAVYQWIPGKLPESMGILRNRINRQYRASDDRFSEYRAIEILEPTIELTGTFICRVSSFHDEEMASRTMIIYAPVKSMNMSFERLPYGVLLNCYAVGAYPKPKVIFTTFAHGKQEIIEPTFEEFQEEDDGSYTVTIETEVPHGILQRESLVQCRLSLPGTRYKIRKEIVYYPANNVRPVELDCNVVPAMMLYFIMHFKIRHYKLL